MNRIPTEREVLRCIYAMYESDHPGKAIGGGRGENDPYIAIDIAAVAADRKCKSELLFGYLFYHLDAKHKYEQSENVYVLCSLLRWGRSVME